MIQEVFDDIRAQPYRGALRRQGWAWTMALLDEDIELYACPANHESARRGLADYRENDFPEISTKTLWGEIG